MSRWGLLSLSPFGTVSPSLTASPMPWIKQISVAEATGFLKQQFDAAIKRAGRVWHIVHIMSLNPRVMKTSIDFYGALLFGRSPLSRVQREMLATVTSAELHCRY